MVSIPYPALRQILELDDSEVLINICDLAKLIHAKSLLKIAEIEIGCDDYYNLEGRQTNKTAVIDMLRRTATWAAAIIRECGGSEIESALPELTPPYTNPRDCDQF